MITHLNHRKIYLKEKLKLIEKILSENVLKRKILKEERNVLFDARIHLEAEKNKIKNSIETLYVVAFVINLK